MEFDPVLAALLGASLHASGGHRGVQHSQFRLALYRRSLAALNLLESPPLNFPEEQLQLWEQVDQHDLQQAIAKLLHERP